MDYLEIITRLFHQIKDQEDPGTLAAYIPELEQVDPENFGIHLITTQGAPYGIGDYQQKFSIQSIAKVLSFSLAYKLKGNSLWERLGVEPAGTAFNSLVQLENDQGIPRNPFINSGALVICDILLSSLSDARTELLGFIREVSDIQSIDYCQKIADSEKSAGYRNVALCNFIKSFGNIRNEVDDVLDFYFKLCSIQLSCEELSKTFLFLANSGNKISGGSAILNPSQTKRLNAIMLTCGFYDEAGEFAYKVGLPGKSGVGGGIIAIHPEKYSIAVWSPRLNKKGNSFRGMRFLEQFTTATKSSIF